MLEERRQKISFEFYPPKTPEAKQSLYTSARMLSQFQPNFFSVTFGAGGSTRAGTLEAITQLKKETPVQVAPHMSCIGYSKTDLIALLKEYKQIDINQIVAIRGDLPSGMVTKGDYQLAVDLVHLIREQNGRDFDIHVAAYPEYHPEAQSAEQDIINLKKKQDAGANAAITQYFYNIDAYFYFLDACAKHQITLPIIPGIMPIMQFTKLVRFSKLCGAEIPRWLYKKLEAYGDDLKSIREFGVEMVSSLCSRLLSGGAPGLHFYTLNQSEICTAILDELNIQPIIEDLPKLAAEI